MLQIETVQEKSPQMILKISWPRSFSTQIKHNDLDHLTNLLIFSICNIYNYIHYSKIKMASTSFSQSKNLGISRENSLLGNSKQASNLFNKISTLENHLQSVKTDLVNLNEQAESVRQQKRTVEQYLNRKADETKKRLTQQLHVFENEVKKRIQIAKDQTSKVDTQIKQLKDIQVGTLQMILALQRRIQEVQVQLGN